jgi:hypothetical protein
MVADCGMVDDCCQNTNDDEDDGIPGLTRNLFNYVVVIVLILAVIEAILYGLFRRHIIGGGERRVAREPEDVNVLADQLMLSFPDAVAPPPAEEGAEGGEEDERTCSICFVDLGDADGQRAVSMPCKHQFHAECIRNYILHVFRDRDEIRCPLCRASIGNTAEIQVASLNVPLLNASPTSDSAPRTRTPTTASAPRVRNPVPTSAPRDRNPATPSAPEVEEVLPSDH